MRILVESDKYADRAVISRVLGSRLVLSGDQKKALVAELKDPAYAGKTASEIVSMLNEYKLVDNPAPPTMVRQSTTVGQLKDWFRPIVFPRLGDSTGQKWLQKSGILLSQYQDSARVEYDSPTFSPLRVDAVKDGLLTQADLDVLMPLVQDIAYNVKLWQSAADVLLGPGSLVDDGDLVGLL